MIADELAVANAHTLGATPWQRADYVRKFRTLTEGVLDDAEAERFLDVAQRLPTPASRRAGGPDHRACRRQALAVGSSPRHLLRGLTR